MAPDVSGLENDVDPNSPDIIPLKNILSVTAKGRLFNFLMNMEDTDKAKFNEDAVVRNNILNLLTANEKPLEKQNAWERNGTFIGVGASFIFIILSCWIFSPLFSSYIHSLDILLKKADVFAISALFGVPLSAALSFIVVTLYGWMTKSEDGFTLNFGPLYFGVRGATGPLILWILCFLFISHAFQES